jgi:hypothetical protein
MVGVYIWLSSEEMEKNDSNVAGVVYEKKAPYSSARLLQLESAVGNSFQIQARNSVLATLDLSQAVSIYLTSVVSLHRDSRLSSNTPSDANLALVIRN